MRSTHVDLLVEESLLEVIVDRVVCDGAEQSHVRHARRLLLLEPFAPVGLGRSAWPPPSLSSSAARRMSDEGDTGRTFCTLAAFAPPPPDSRPPTTPFFPAFLDGACEGESEHRTTARTEVCGWTYHGCDTGRMGGRAKMMWPSLVAKGWSWRVEVNTGRIPEDLNVGQRRW